MSVSKVVNWIFVRLILNAYPGKYRLFCILRDLKLIPNTICFRTPWGSMDMPGEQWTFWRFNGPLNYGPLRLNYLSNLVCELVSEFELVDLGADIGAFSLGMYQRCPDSLTQIIALEPNPFSYQYLEKNLSSLPIPTRSLNKAIGAKNGRVELVFDKNLISDHGGYIDTTKQGDTEVVTLDSIAKVASPNLVLKVDVEGQEKEVFDGSNGSLSNYEVVVLFVEIKADILERSGSSSEEIFSAAESTRDFDWHISDFPYTKVDRERPFFDQFPSDKQFDVIGISRSN